jgi:prepilin-type N-terminal cleavage/methylation domain-containing protein
MTPTTLQARSRRGGFTLVELLLAVTLLGGLMAAAIFGFSSLQRSAQLNEGVERVETAMRFARAHAANTGRKVQVVVTTTEASSPSADSSPSTPAGNPSDSNQSLSILWEADPARAPGVFEAIPSLSGDVADVSELVEIRSVGRESKEAKDSSPTDVSTTIDIAPLASPTETVSTSTPRESESETPSDSSARSGLETNPSEATITFYPDGSCDGATIVLASKDSDDAREVAVLLESVTGTTRRRWRESANFGGTETTSPQGSASVGSSLNDPNATDSRSTSPSLARTATSPATAKTRR